MSIHQKKERKNVKGQNETRYASEILQIKCSESEYIKYLQPNKNEQESCPISMKYLVSQIKILPFIHQIKFSSNNNFHNH